MNSTHQDSSGTLTDATQASVDLPKIGQEIEQMQSAVAAIEERQCPASLTPRSDEAAIPSDGESYVRYEFACGLELELHAARLALDARIQPVEFGEEDFIILSTPERCTPDQVDEIARQLSNVMRIKRHRIIFLSGGISMSTLRKEALA